MTRAQLATFAAQQRAAFHSKRDGIEWWKLPDASWLGVKETTLKGVVTVKRFPAGACACG